ncbi:MAG: LysM peptidoglycan-binding domain-containing protein [Opitutales bacterium]
MKLTKIFGIVLSLHVAVILLVMFQPGCQTFTGKGEDEGEKTEDPTGGNPSGAFNSGLGVDPAEPEVSPKITGSGERFSPTRPGLGELLVPKEPSLQPELRPSDVTVYKVRQGDSLWSIASRNKITLEQVLEKNNIDKEATLSIGQEIFLPVTGSVPLSGLTSETEEKPVSTGVEVHVVRKGDTLSAIAQTYGVSVNAIKDANNLRSNLIQIGQRLLVPGGAAVETPLSVPKAIVETPTEVPSVVPVGGQITHVVQSGETLTAIAAHYGVPVKLLADMNGISDPNTLKLGQTLIVQPAPITEESQPAPDPQDDIPKSLKEIFEEAPQGVVVPLPPPPKEE